MFEVGWTRVRASCLLLLRIISGLSNNDLRIALSTSREARRADRYIEVDPEKTLAEFMVNGWPDEERFKEVIGGLLARAHANGAKVRAFGEMVALLWGKKLYAATVRLDISGTGSVLRKAFSLLCAYPLSGPTSIPWPFDA